MMRSVPLMSYSIIINILTYYIKIATSMPY